MGYRDDFYKADNIVGYTGKIGEKPTVYFETEEEIGHITQFHKILTNIGRERVFGREGYGAYNTDEGTDKVRLQEWEGKKMVHVSRNELISTEGMSAKDQDTLAQAVWLFPEIKEMYGKK